MLTTMNSPICRLIGLSNRWYPKSAVGICLIPKTSSVSVANCQCTCWMPSTQCTSRATLGNTSRKERGSLRACDTLRQASFLFWRYHNSACTLPGAPSIPRLFSLSGENAESPHQEAHARLLTTHYSLYVTHFAVREYCSSDGQPLPGAINNSQEAQQGHPTNQTSVIKNNIYIYTYVVCVDS